jgi:uncharacterized membrane protein
MGEKLNSAHRNPDMLNTDTRLPLVMLVLAFCVSALTLALHLLVVFQVMVYLCAVGKFVMPVVSKFSKVISVSKNHCWVGVSF